MRRRRFLKGAAALGATPFWPTVWSSTAPAAGGGGNRPFSRVRPGNAAWPSEASWNELSRNVGGRLVRVRSPLAECTNAPMAVTCSEVFTNLKNPYYLGDNVGLTQSLGWTDAWTSQPSAYAVVAESAEDVVAAVNFANANNLRLVVKGGGHSYKGTSNAADSLLIWTRRMNAITVHEAFAPAGCARPEQPAVTVQAGAMWGQVYDAVTTKAGRYVQGGGCLTVGVAGLIQSGGFGSFSKAYGLAAASLLEAEVVTADGKLRIANACTNSDLFWGLKGGGGGSLGVVTRLTLRTHDLPEFFGATNMVVKAASDAAFRRLIGQLIRFYSEALFNRHWGEKISFRPGNVLAIAMLSQGLSQTQAESTWRPFLDWIAASPQDLTLISAPTILGGVPARQFWDPEVLSKVPGLVVTDDRPGSPATNIFYANDVGEVGQVLHGYQSAWLPAALLRPEQQQRLGDALFAASRHWSVTLHVNKGLAGAPAEAIAGATDTATNPLVLDAFALLISAAQGPPAYPGIPGREPDLSAARRHAEAIGKAMAEIERVIPVRGAYVAESDFFDAGWRESYWGTNYPRLLAVKDKYDPEGLFIAHHGVGSERWSADGFRRLRP